MLLYIIRHGDPDYTTDSLTPRGVLQAEAVGKRIRDAGVDRIFSSPMGRAQQTAEPACRLLGLPCEIEPWTHEVGREKNTTYPDGVVRSLGAVQNTVLLDEGRWDLNCSRAFEHPAFADTQLPAARQYIEENGRAFLERLGYREENGIFRILRPNEEKIALFCHGFFARTWLSILLHIPYHVMLASFEYTHTGVTTLRFANNENGVTAPACLSFCDMSHLYAYGPDMQFNGKIEL